MTFFPVRLWRSPRRSTASGQTLIEIMISIFVIVLLVAGITGLAGITTRLSVQSERQTVALAIVNEAMEQMRATSFPDVGFSDAQEGEPPGVLTRVENVTENGQPYTITRLITYYEDPLTAGPDEDIREFQVMVTWDTPGSGTSEVTAKTFRTNEPINFGTFTCPSRTLPDPTLGFCVLLAGEDPPPLACAEDAHCLADDVCAEGLCTATCTDDTQCAGGKECVNQLCTAIGACETTADCAAGQECFAKQCTATCVNATQCGAGEACAEGLCRTSCTASNQCNGDEACVDQLCTALCVNNNQCGAGEACVHGLCAATCEDSADCASGQGCSSRGLCAATCEDSADCASGEACVAGLCTAIPTVCDTNFQCGDEYCCNPSSGACVPNTDPACTGRGGGLGGAVIGGGGEFCAARCVNNNQCGAGETCVNNICAVVGGACETTADCAADQECVDGQCTTICRGNNMFCEAKECEVPADCARHEDIPTCKPVGDECRGFRTEAQCLHNQFREQCNYNCTLGEAPSEDGCFSNTNCANENDCGASEDCVAGQCVATCGETADCRPGAECVDGYCRLEPIPVGCSLSALGNLLCCNGTCCNPADPLCERNCDPATNASCSEHLTSGGLTTACKVYLVPDASVNCIARDPDNIAAGCEVIIGDPVPDPDPDPTVPPSSDPTVPPGPGPTIIP